METIWFLSFIKVAIIAVLFLLCGPTLCKDTSTLLENSEDGICTAKQCKIVAKRMLKNLNQSVDPCSNFYQYACGGWMDTHKIPEKKEEYSAINELADNNDKVLKQLLADTYKGQLCSKDHPANTKTIMKVKNFYKSCIDIRRINKLGAKPLQDFIEKLGSWDIAGSDDFDVEKWDFQETLRLLHAEYPAEIFFTVDVDVDPKNRTRNIITIDEAKLSLPLVSYYTNPKAKNRSIEYATAVALLTRRDREEKGNALREEILMKMRNVHNFEEKLIKLSVPKPAKRFTRTSLDKLQEAVTQFDWVSHLKAVLKKHKDVDPKEKVVVLSNDFYLRDLFILINNTDAGTLSNYMMWRMVKDMVPFLSDDFTKEYNSFRADLTGSRHDKPRHETCFKYTDEILGPLVGSLFFRYAFCPDDKDEVEEMMEYIVLEFIDNAEHVDWISKQTLEAVKEKAKAVVKKVGYPDYLFNEEKFEKRYKDITTDEKTFFDNVVSIDKFSNQRTFKKLNLPVDPHQWVSVSHMANAFYVVTKNEIVIPAGILQPPFFYGKPIPRSVSYGAIGHVLGHELTHGFDTLGRKFDEKGQLIRKRSISSKPATARSSSSSSSSSNAIKWSKESINRFNSRTEGLKNQFDKFTIGNSYLHIDGSNTLGENIADAGGVKMAYTAYAKWVEDNGEEYRLPYLGKTNEELFFIGYAQKECHLSSKKAMEEAIKDDVHAPSMFRITGTLSNSKEFAKAFKCSKKTRMNPEDKVSIW